MLDYLNCKELFDKITPSEDEVNYIMQKLENMYNEAIIDMMTYKKTTSKRFLPTSVNADSVAWRTAFDRFNEILKIKSVSDNNGDYYMLAFKLYDEEYKEESFVKGVEFELRKEKRVYGTCNSNTSTCTISNINC